METVLYGTLGASNNIKKTNRNFFHLHYYHHVFNQLI